MGLTRLQHAKRAFITDLKLGWSAAIGLAVAYLVPCLLGLDLESRLRWAGLMLQVGGLLTVAYGLIHRHREFRPEKFWEAVNGWLRRCWWIVKPPSPNIINVSTHTKVELKPGSLHVTSWNASAETDEKIELLRTRLDNLQGYVSKKVSKLQGQVTDLQQKLAKEKRERRNTMSSLEEQVSELAVGGLGLEFVGLVWLFAGMILSAIPAELASFF